MMDDQPQVVIRADDGTEHVFPAGFDPKRAAAIVRGGAVPSQPQQAPAPEKGYLSQGWDFVKRHPTEIGATLGGIAAVPLTGGTSLIPAMAAAGLGGAGGAGLGMMAGAAGGTQDVPSSPGGVLQKMGEQGLTQGLAEGAGRLISGTLKAGASRLYQSVLKPTLAARREFPNLVETGLANRVPVTPGGLEKAGDMVGASKQAADDLVANRAAQPNAPTIDPRQAVSGITSAVQNVKDLPVARPQMKAIGDYGRAYLSEHPQPLTLPDAQRAVRATDRYYDPTYRATMDKGNPVTSGQAAAAVGINNETRNMLRTAVPGLQGQNANTQALEGLRQAVERRVGEQGNRSAVGMQHLINAGIGTAVGTGSDSSKTGTGAWLAMEALTNPRLASQLAIGGGQLSKIPYSAAVRAALLGQLRETEPTAGTESR